MTLEDRFWYAQRTTGPAEEPHHDTDGEDSHRHGGQPTGGRASPHLGCGDGDRAVQPDVVQP